MLTALRGRVHEDGNTRLARDGSDVRAAS
jgi:hypothetical protein